MFQGSLAISGIQLFEARLKVQDPKALSDNTPQGEDPSPETRCLVGSGPQLRVWLGPLERNRGTCSLSRKVIKPCHLQETRNDTSWNHQLQ